MSKKYVTLGGPHACTQPLHLLHFETRDTPCRPLTRCDDFYIRNIQHRCIEKQCLAQEYKDTEHGNFVNAKYHEATEAKRRRLEKNPMYTNPHEPPQPDAVVGNAATGNLLPLMDLNAKVH